MNFNHPLAGCELQFSGKVVDIRDATEKELIQGLYGERAEDASRKLRRLFLAAADCLPDAKPGLFPVIRLLLVTGVLSNPAN